MVFYMGFSEVEIAHRPNGLCVVSTCSISFKVSKLKTKILSSSTMTKISLRSFRFLMSLWAENVISVRFFFSWSSQMTTLFFYFVKTSTMILVLYIISISSTDSPKN